MMTGNSARAGRNSQSSDANLRLCADAEAWRQGQLGEFPVVKGPLRPDGAVSEGMRCKAVRLLYHLRPPT